MACCKQAGSCQVIDRLVSVELCIVSRAIREVK